MSLNHPTSQGGHSKVLIHHDLQPNRDATSKGLAPASTSIASVHVGNSRSYSVNRTSSTVAATSAASTAQPAGTLMNRELKTFNKSMAQASHNTGGQASNSIQSRMSESVVMVENRGGDKNLRGAENQRRAESLNPATSNVGSKVYQTRKPSPSVHSNNQNPSKFYNQVPHVSLLYY